MNLKNQIACKVWKENKPPHKVLIIRLQAMGDTVITLPYLLSLKKQHPETKLHFITRQEVSTIPKGIVLFEKIFSIRGGRNTKLQFLFSLFMLPMLWIERYDMVIDLQNNRISKILRQLVFARSWSEFDKYSAIPAGERTKHTIEAVGFSNIDIETDFTLRISDQSIQAKLDNTKRRVGSTMIVFNPAGAFETRHWPIENYVSLASLFKRRYNNVQFLLLGEKGRMTTPVNYLVKHIQEDIIDFTGQTNAVEAFAMLKLADLVITEDSGLMHMAWVQGVPTLALFGSSRSDWSAPVGDRSICLNSSDLPCGNCMLEVCKYGDNHCLTRYSPQMVFEKAIALLK